MKNVEDSTILKGFGTRSKVTRDTPPAKYTGGKDVVISPTALRDTFQAAVKDYKAGRRVAPHIARARASFSLPWVRNPPPSWFSEFFVHTQGDTEPGRPVQFAISAWVASKLLAISDTPNWFRPTDALVHMLLATELRGALIGDLHLPYDAFYIELPPGVIQIYDSITHWHDVSVLTVTRGEITESVLEKARELGDPTADFTSLGARLLIEASAEPNENSTGLWDDAWSFRSYRIGDPDLPLDEVVHGSMDATERSTALVGRVGDKALTGAEVRSALLRLVFNLCIYMSSEASSVRHVHEAEIKRLHGNKKWKALRKTVQDRIKRLQSDRVFAVGSDVVIDPELREAVRSGELAGSKLSYRVLVRGHWRNQACGLGRKDRKQLWIKPHVRGTELPTPVVGHNYEVR